jgi:hypothetical protein
LGGIERQVVLELKPHQKAGSYHLALQAAQRYKQDVTFFILSYSNFMRAFLSGRTEPSPAQTLLFACTG